MIREGGGADICGWRRAFDVVMGRLSVCWIGDGPGYLAVN